jgi:hypothetical protein
VFLHGALHLFPENNRTVRLTNQGKTLLSQIETRLGNGEFPIFISEATGPEKRGRRYYNDYLHDAAEKFDSICKEANSTLFTFGQGFTDADEHIIDAIGRGKIGRVYLGAYGCIDAPGVRDWAGNLAERWRRQRVSGGAKFPLQVHVYDTEKRKLWKDLSGAPDPTPFPTAR